VRGRRAGADGEHGGEEALLVADRRATHPVDAPVQPLPAPGALPGLDLARGQAGVHGLDHGEQGVLAPGDAGQRFFGHFPTSAVAF
jgi:hypothetical protein